MATGLNQYRNITTATTTTCRTGAGILNYITINKAVAAGVITVYDNTAASGTKIATITEPNPVTQNWGTIPIGVAFKTGLTVVTGAADDLTICWEPQ